MQGRHEGCWSRLTRANDPLASVDVRGQDLPLLLPRSRVTLPDNLRRMLERTAAEGGRLSISGLSNSEMLREASTALALKSRGLVRTSIQFSMVVPGQPVLLEVEMTSQGTKALSRLVS